MNSLFEKFPRDTRGFDHGELVQPDQLKFAIIDFGKRRNRKSIAELRGIGYRDHERFIMDTFIR